MIKISQYGKDIEYPCVTAEGYRLWLEAAQLCTSHYSYDGSHRKAYFCGDCTKEFHALARASDCCQFPTLAQALKAHKRPDPRSLVAWAARNPAIVSQVKGLFRKGVTKADIRRRTGLSEVRIREILRAA